VLVSFGQWVVSVWLVGGQCVVSEWSVLVSVGQWVVSGWLVGGQLVVSEWSVAVNVWSVCGQ